MKLYINGKVFSLHRKYSVSDVYGQDIYEISSEFFTIGHKTTIKKLTGEKIAYIKQKVFRFFPTYDVYIRDKIVCRITRKFNLLKRKYELSNGYRVEGNFTDLNFSIYAPNNKEVATIKKKFFSFKEKYEINIHDEGDIALPLAIVVAITNDIWDETANSISWSTAASLSSSG